MISAVIPAYNRAGSIGRAVDSVLAQTRKVDEILIVDDASTDDLAAALAPYGARVRHIRHDSNRGASAARNTGIAEAKGEWIALLDSDDAWLPEKIERQIPFMEAADLEASCTNFFLVPPESEDRHAAWRPYDEPLTLLDAVWGCYVSPGSTLVARKDLLERLSGYDTSFPRYEDWDLLIRMARATRAIGFLQEPLATIYLGTHLSPDAAEAGLDRMEAKHWSPLAGLGYGTRFKAALAFNRASVSRLEGDYLSMLLQLAQSAWLYPFGNWPLKVVLRDRIRRS
ncbi:UDP-Glc:alpha-D-GlcNAc-diphosphoundecaprenol beta-1,3-glucosyltransferase WfgD [Methyloligella halotolerans]|uniref:UDP-Glc:alpha-D-GlcNAc-diphosphoundecaprenol beta-1,3-glucosyltransferase WfgD n=1 Tax=Methyloligella halotolerans TaxID=1177755 RepID=A0A1E2S2E8_9HYPH|nr:glycosyltransferase family 2 protein [Methyloligella halotolerans]ODA68686.1 UDP-Glc:alpha-D-GlcNAc-diphosphoundecaprenol beta-1,3-glucosyltransferase WfgD [Methyloligella halotolerans]